MKALHAELLTELAKIENQPIHFIEVYLESETVRLTNAFKDITWDDNTYLSTGHFLGFSDVEETQQTIISSVTVSLSGIDSIMISKLLAQNYLDRDLKIYLGALDENNDLVGVPFLMFEGRMDNPTIKDDNKKTTISVKATNIWVDFSRKTGRRFNHNEQQIYFEGDNGFSYCAQNRENLTWGK